MYIVVMHKHSFNQYQFLSSSITFSNGVYTITDTGGSVHAFDQTDYLIAIMG